MSLAAAQQPAPQSGAPGAGQPQQQQPAGPAIPDDFKLNMMVRTAIIALNQANQTGNYTVLRDLGATSFRVTNDASRLAEIFAKLRKRQLDLSPTLFFMPKLIQKPQVDPRGVLRLVGFFETAPERVNFDLYYVPELGQWRLFGIGVVLTEAQPATAALGNQPAQPGAPAQPAPQKAAAPAPAPKPQEKPAKAAAPAAPKPKPQAAVENKTTNNTVRIDLSGPNADPPKPSATASQGAQSEAEAAPAPASGEKEEGFSLFPW